MTITLFETLAIKNKQILNLSYHNDRFKKGQVFLNCKNLIDDIATLINIPTHFDNDKLIRVRVTYNKSDIKVEYFDYTPKSIYSFKVIECNDIDYYYKYDDRSVLNTLLSQKETCDEIIIIKNGFVTDCSIGNLLFLKNGIWYTPDTPLLNGTQRAYLLDNNKIKLASIKKDDICHYEKVMMINALNPFDECGAVDVAHVIHDDLS
ncbi:MAG: aminotransferase class IV [Moraxella sp.]|uniref:aminotransferase class IV n=1 Tax=Moraxella sp. TaxID=479 RepID=UPI0026DB7B2E|nr:aminotransferase class IV [Moraxella sp.]MDO4450262.1 aminotransferase class IV [Moraxella sp.]